MLSIRTHSPQPRGATYDAVATISRLPRSATVAPPVFAGNTGGQYGLADDLRARLALRAASG
eukprot:1947440-Prymnesium_polylepis.1